MLIDFGFMLSNSPGNMYFESAPFKLTQEFVDVMGGAESRLFQYFKVSLLSFQQPTH
jgi:phosphatidylinositol kinase/protein kinase (PI-3  family)